MNAAIKCNKLYEMENMNQYVLSVLEIEFGGSKKVRNSNKNGISH
jgi:hypothetical protein